MIEEQKLPVKVNFRVAPEDKPNVQGARCITHISVGQDYHEGDKFAETMALINQTFSVCKTMLCDGLQRHTLKLTFPELDEETLYEKAMQEGDQWLDRNQEVFKRMTIPHEIIRWDTWLKHPDYPKNREIIEALYADNKAYREAVKRTIDKFLSRLQKRDPNLDYEKAFNICLPYLAEECAVIIPIWVKENCEFIIYPRPRTDAMEMTYQLLVQKDYPHLLRPIALKFNHRSKNSPYYAGNSSSHHKEINHKNSNDEKIHYQETSEFFINNSKLFENIIAVMPLHVYWKNIRGQYMGCNNQQAKSLGLKSRRDIIHCTPYAKLPKETAEKLRQIDAEVIRTGEMRVTQEPGIRSDGTEGIFLTHKIPLKNDTAEVIGILGVSVDITPIKELQSRLKIERDHAKQADELKSEFIRNMEHDIRTPFCGICSLNELLADRETDPEKKKLLLMAIASGKRLLKYCNDILQFSPNQKSLPVTDKKFNLKKIMDDAVKIEMPAATAKNLNLTLEYPEDVPIVVIGDEYRTYRILINLISNAVKFTKKGQITVKAKFIQRENRQAIIDLIVLDTGIGIPPEKQNIIYERFVKGTESNRGLYSGSGLGLYIVKKFVHELNGDINFKTSPNGTTFICSLKFKLPLHDNLP